MATATEVTIFGGPHDGAVYALPHAYPCIEVAEPLPLSLDGGGVRIYEVPIRRTEDDRLVADWHARQLAREIAF